MKNYERYSGIGWMTFYIKWRFPIGFIVGILGIMSGLSELISYKNMILPNIYDVYLAITILNIAVYFFRIPVYREMRKMTIIGYDANMALLVLETIQLAVNQAFNNSISADGTFSYFGYGLLISAISAFLVWYLPNYLYFKHREFRFNGLQSIDTLRTEIKNNADFKTVKTKNADNECDEQLSIFDISEHSSEDELSNENVGGTDVFENQRVRFCRKCGIELHENAVFCHQCGTKIFVGVNK